MTSSMATGIQVVIDCADPARLAEFWAAALGYTPQPPPSGFGTWPEFLRARGVPESDWNSANAVIDPGQRGPRLFFQRVPEEKTVKNRVHLDLNLGGGPGTALETGSYPCSRPCWLARSSTWTMRLPLHSLDPGRMEALQARPPTHSLQFAAAIGGLGWAAFGLPTGYALAAGIVVHLLGDAMEVDSSTSTRLTGAGERRSG
jgi:hypothetical protein